MLSDLAGLCVHIHCTSCGRMLARRAEEVIAEVGDVSLDQLARRMRCTKCGRRGPTLSPWTGAAFDPLWRG